MMNLVWPKWIVSSQDGTSVEHNRQTVCAAIRNRMVFGHPWKEDNSPYYLLAARAPAGVVLTGNWQTKFSASFGVPIPRHCATCG